jgi:hypothetical protein
MPELTAERRKEYVKLVKAKAEDAKVRIRGIRRQIKDDLDALKDEIGEDDIARAEKELDALTKAHVDKVDEALKHCPDVRTVLVVSRTGAPVAWREGRDLAYADERAKVSAKALARKAIDV